MKKIHRILEALLLFAGLQLTIATEGYAQENGKHSTPTASGYAPVNGVKMYYEVYGTGKPLLLLHGAFMTIDLNWAELIPELSKTRKVIAVEMQGHGRTADTERPFSMESFADDVAGVLKYLKIDSADVMGYSMGGSVAYQLAIAHTAMVKNLIIISSTYKSEGWQPELEAAFKSFKPAFFDNTPLKTDYIRVAPDTAHWEKFVTKMIAWNNIHFDLGDQNIKSLKMPVLLIMGDNDGVDKKVLAETYRMLGGAVMGDMAGLPKSQLAILPGKTHVSLMMETAAILSMTNSFLK